MKEKRLLLSVPVEGDSSFCTHIDVELYYSKGGMNYFTGSNEKRGYYVSVQPLTKGENSYSYSAFSGFKKLIKECGRFSYKTLSELKVDEEVITSLIDSVVRNSNNSFKIKDFVLQLN